MPWDHQAARWIENSGGDDAQSRNSTCFDRNMTELGQTRHFDYVLLFRSSPKSGQFQSRSALRICAKKRHRLGCSIAASAILAFTPSYTILPTVFRNRGI